MGQVKVCQGLRCCAPAAKFTQGFQPLWLSPRSRSIPPKNELRKRLGCCWGGRNLPGLLEEVSSRRRAGPHPALASPSSPRSRAPPRLGEPRAVEPSSSKHPLPSAVPEEARLAAQPSLPGHFPSSSFPPPCNYAQFKSKASQPLPSGCGGQGLGSPAPHPLTPRLHGGVSLSARTPKLQHPPLRTSSPPGIPRLARKSLRIGSEIWAPLGAHRPHARPAALPATLGVTRGLGRLGFKSIGAGTHCDCT